MLCAANAVATVGVILAFLCVGLPYWASTNQGKDGREVFLGLWEFCTTINFDIYVCRTYSEGDTCTKQFTFRILGEIFVS